MRPRDLAMANLRRRKGRALLLALTIAFSCGAVTAMNIVTGAMSADVADAFDQIGANIVVLPAETRSFGYAGVSVPPATAAAGGPDSAMPGYLPGSVLGGVRAIPNKDNIAIVAPKLLVAVETPSGPALAVGVRFPAELRLKKWWRVNWSSAAEPARGEVVLGSAVARRWGLGPGDAVQLQGRLFTVAGVIEALGSDEDRAIWMDLEELQSLSGLGDRVSLVELAALCTSCPIDEIVAQLRDKLPGARVAAVKSAVNARRAVVDRFAGFTRALSLALGLLGLLAVALVALGSARERTREIGLLRAIGFRGRHILAVFYTEAATLGVAGAAVGVLSGWGLAVAVGPLIAGITARTVNAGALAVTALVAVAAVLLASAPPAVRAARTDPVSALRYL